VDDTTDTREKHPTLPTATHKEMATGNGICAETYPDADKLHVVACNMATVVADSGVSAERILLPLVLARLSWLIQ